MKKVLLWLIASCYLLIAVCASAQTSQTGSDYIARRLQIALADPPQKVPGASVSVSGNPGPATYFYWIVTNSLVGASSPAGPFAIVTAPNTLGVSNFNVVSWSTSLGGVNYDVLRTATPGPPFGACNCAVATAITGNTVNDQSNSLNAYTVNTLDPSTLVWTLTNESTGSGISQFTLRAGGVAKFTLASNAAAVTVVTPFTAPAHQFLTSLSGGGIFSAAQPASADISDGTGTGVVVRQTGASLASPTISGAAMSSTGGLIPSFQSFTSSGTFTIPTGVTAVKVTIVGGGGAGGGATAGNVGSGGGSGGVAIKWLSGLTPGNTITVTVGNGGTGVSGAAGNSGGASSISSGTQTITTVTANGGGGGNSQAAPAGGGNGAAISTNGDINGGGVPGYTAYVAPSAGGGSTFMGGAGNVAAASNGGNAAVANTGSGGGGAGAGASNPGGAGAAGRVIFEWTN